SLTCGVTFLSLGLVRPIVRWKMLRRLMEMSVLARRVLFSGHRRLFIILMSIAIHLLTALIAWAAARAVMAPLEYRDAFLLVLPVMWIAAMLISIAGWGLRESALVLAFSYAGLPESDGLIVSVLL